MDEVKTFLTEMGLPPVAIALAIAVGGILFVVVKLVAKRKIVDVISVIEKRKNMLRKYRLEQESALMEAYRMLYERDKGKGITDLSQTEFVKIIKKADNIIMKPFTKKLAELPHDVRTKMYNDIHNVLAQFKPHPMLRDEI